MREFCKNELRAEMKRRRSALNNEEAAEAGKKIYGYMEDIIKQDKDILVLLFASYQNEPDKYMIT